MKKTRNRLPRDRQVIVDVLNYEEGRKPSTWLRWFVDERYGLDPETLRQIRDELRGVLFENAPNGRREYGSLVHAAQEYPIKIYPVPLENNEGVGTNIPDPADPREHIYRAIIEAIRDGSFQFLQQSCKNCGRHYWHRGDYCNLECGQEYNSKQAKVRMARLRAKKKGKKRGN